jgi:hypothetical protein
MKEHIDNLKEVGLNFDAERNELYYIGDDTKFWDKCSKAFAEQASGDVHVIEGTDPRPPELEECTYNRIEHPALANKEKVNSITSIDAYSGNETGKVERFDREVSRDFEMSF